MPIYEYICRDCSCLFEVIKPITALEDSNPACIRCGGSQTFRKLVNFTVLTGVKDASSRSTKNSRCTSCSTSKPSLCSCCRK